VGADKTTDYLKQEPMMLKCDGFDDCVFGVCERNGNTFIIYDKTRILLKLMKRDGKLMKRDGMTAVEAEEYYYFNIAGAFMDMGPGYIEEVSLKEIEESYEWT
jgi:hypothetical protein